MKKCIAVCLVLLMAVLAGCGDEPAPAVPTPAAVTPTCAEAVPALGDCQLLLVNGGLYYNTCAETTALYGSPDNRIQSSRYPGNVPDKENQSNFGAGYEYYIDGENHLSVCIDGTWWRFARVAPVNPWGLELSVENIGPNGGEIVCRRTDSQVTETITVGAAVWLERWGEGGWEPADGLIHVMDMDWGTDRWSIETGETLRWAVDWTPYYEPLAAGRYRLYKQFRCVTEDGGEQYYNVYALFEVTADSLEMPNRHGVTMTAASVTPTGLTLTINRSEASDWEIITGQAYTIETLSGMTWVPYERTDGLMIDFAWEDIAYVVQADAPLTMAVDWEWLYGSLPAGDYRLCKEFYGSLPIDRDPPYERFTASAEFRME